MLEVAGCRYLIRTWREPGGRLWAIKEPYDIRPAFSREYVVKQRGAEPFAAGHAPPCNSE